LDPRRLLCTVLVALLPAVGTSCAEAEDLGRFSVADDGGDATLGDEVASDAEGDGGPDAAADSGGDAAPEAAADCGPTDTTTNCAGCGNACDTTNSSGATCDGTTCHYTGCDAGRADCDMSAPDTNGCECPTPGCCGSGCQVRHDTGVKLLSYYDCTPIGTYDMTQASEACLAFTGNVAMCQNDVIVCGGDGGSEDTICTPTAGKCACWDYSGAAAGYMHKSANATCKCPTTGETMWN